MDIVRARAAMVCAAPSARIHTLCLRLRLWLRLSDIWVFSARQSGHQPILDLSQIIPANAQQTARHDHLKCVDLLHL